MRNLTVLVADGQELFSDCLARAIGDDRGIEVIPEYPASGSEAIHAAGRLRADVVVLDYWLPALDMDGAEIIGRLLDRPEPPRVLVISWVHSPAHVAAALEAGAAGFLPKSVSVDQLIEAVRRAHAGEVPVFAEELARLLDDIDAQVSEGQEQFTRLKKLTRREIDVLQLLAQGLSNPEVARVLHLAPGTIDTAIHRILRKLGTRTKLEAIALARQQHLLESPNPAGTSGPPSKGHYWTP